MIYNEDPDKCYDCTTGVVHDAIYTKPLLSIDMGDRNIEAMPPRLSEDQIAELYYKPMRVTPSLEGSVELMKAEISLLDELRIPVPFAEEFEDAVYNKLLVSYRTRRNLLLPISENVVIGDKEDRQDFTMQPSLNSDGDMGIALLGVGGTGKTNAIHCLTTHYPQAVRHITEKGTYVQIFWIRIEVPATGDLETMFNSFGTELDRALGNKKPVYFTLIKKQQKLAQKVLMISNLIRRFSIGLFIIDEIQRLKFGKANKIDSYSNIIDIVDKSKVVLIVAGTEKAFSLFVGKYYDHRRIGVEISTTESCYDRDNFDIIASSIMSVNWFKTPQPLDDKRNLDAMFAETSGTIARIISVWKTLQYEYVMLSDEEKQVFVLTPEFIHLCSRKQNRSQAEDIRLAVDTDFAMRMKMLEDDGEKLYGPETMNLMPQAVLAQDENEIIEKQKSRDISYRLMSLPRPDCAMRLFERAKINLSENGFVVPETTVEEAVTIILNQKVSLKQDESELLKKILQKVRILRKKKNSPPKLVNGSDEIPEIKLDEFSADILELKDK